MRRRLIAPLLLPLLAFVQSPDRSLLAEAIPKPNASEVTATQSGAGVEVKIVPGANGYPGVGFVAPAGSWDLSKFGHVETRLVNLGAKPITISLRVDNAGDWQADPWNTESVTLDPGKAGTVRTVFGYQYGMRKGFRLDPSKVVNVLLFTTKADGPQAFRIESLMAGGPAHETPPVASDDVRVRPTDGMLFDARIYASGHVGITGQEGGTVAGTAVAYPKTGAGIARVGPKVGRWDLREATEARVSVRNVGSKPVAPRVRLETNGGDSPWMIAPTLAPGETREIAMPFACLVDLNEPETRKGVTNDSVRAVAVGIAGPGEAGALLAIESVRAVSVVAKTPDWLGKRPPVPGAWTKTLSEEFGGTRLDPTVWKVTGENYYDKVSHWSKDDVIVKDGMARLRYKKRTGFQNDDPKRNSTPYAAGYLDTYGLWKQRYGYFEARIRAPRAPGLWPAFWTMPDRGSKAGPEQWKRQDTANGGMEFDVFETLTRWGPHRTNIAMHYDGYGTDHKQLGSDRIYFETDRDGFVTCGLLWTPGEAVYYLNGKEALRWKSPRVSNVPAILMFTLPSGGWDNDALDDAQLPADFVIDYVRVWQREDLASPTDGRRKDARTE